MMARLRPTRFRPFFFLPGLLNLAAAPVFGIMAVTSIAIGDERLALICSTTQGPSWLVGMVPMYLLMSVFHLAPWLRLLERGQGAGHG